MDWMNLLSGIFGGAQGMPDPGKFGMMGDKSAFNYGEAFGPAMAGASEMMGPGMASLYGKDVPFASKTDPEKMLGMMSLMNQQNQQPGQEQGMRAPGAFGARFPQQAFMQNSPMATMGQNPYAQAPQMPRRKTGIFGG